MRKRESRIIGGLAAMTGFDSELTAANGRCPVTYLSRDTRSLISQIFG
jgi:hypothetical protein